jgi:hypothetical protein
MDASTFFIFSTLSLIFGLLANTLAQIENLIEEKIYSSLHVGVLFIYSHQNLLMRILGLFS